MRLEMLKVYRSPGEGGKLTLMKKGRLIESGRVIEGVLKGSGNEFRIKEGIPDFTWPKKLSRIDEKTRKDYDLLADEYHKFASIPFETYYSDESKIRERMVDQLNIKPGGLALEIGCGDGRSSEHIVKRLGKKGKLCLQELSPAFLKKAVKRLEKYHRNVEFSVANGCYLSFPDKLFDAAHHFGGLNTFSDIKRCLSELARVVKTGGKVVVGDESMAPWLRDCQFGRIMMNSNPLLKCGIPLADIPLCARDVKLEWIMMGAFYVIEFTVGEAEPVGNYHIPIPSNRGGTHWSRYYGYDKKI
ncbi:MAG: class I SAM-dependent methyltransferase [Candidatus Omnitrophica bacterium]|nr:class I SAM-dependent methyltransferase [Candidatus Omnitrophota bacterium]